MPDDHRGERDDARYYTYWKIRWYIRHHDAVHFVAAYLLTRAPVEMLLDLDQLMLERFGRPVPEAVHDVADTGEPARPAPISSVRGADFGNSGPGWIPPPPIPTEQQDPGDGKW